MEITEEAPHVEPVGFSLNEGWSSTVSDGSTNNILYIAVEYVKDDLNKLDDAGLGSEVFTEFQDDVSPLDPNMSSVARYSPVYKSDSRVAYNNPVVLTQLISTDANEGETPIITEAIEGHGLEQVVANPYLLTDQNIVANNFKIENDNGNEEVDILITDQSTGISYLVERCLADDSQLLDSDPLMDSDLLALDDAALKSQLSKIIVEEPVLVDFATSKSELNNLNAKTEPRPQRQLKKDTETEEQLLACVQQISDKPILSRAKATLPESHLVINKISEEELGVFAKKFIPKRTQFGPIEGVLALDVHSKNDIIDDGITVHLSIENDDAFNIINVSNEDTSNWMCFVRLAQCFKEQNLVLTQIDGNLYYTTSKNILPKQELKVFYGASYAASRNLKVFEPEVEEDDLWDCYECSKKFTSFNLLQKHLDEHDRELELKTGKKKKRNNNVIVETSKDQKFKCNICSEEFKTPKYDELQQHLKHHGIDGKTDLRDIFLIVIDSKAILNYIKDDPKSKSENKSHKCPVCYKTFASGERIQKHMLVHGSEEMKPLQCDKCNKRFLNNSALTCHLKTHLFGSKIFECPICKESFQHVLQLKMHVPKHCIDGRYTCPLCLKVFDKYNIIRKHIRGFHCERKHPCPDCGKQFATVDKLRMHLLKHSDHREFLCSDCGKQFKRKDKLKEHCKRMHLEERENAIPRIEGLEISRKKFKPKVLPTDFNRFIYKCHTCLLGFKRRGMLVNHLAKRHPDISRDSVPELNLPILKATKDYYCNYCEKVYKSSSKRKAHILKNHPGGVLPLSNRHLDSAKLTVLPNPTYSATVGSVTTHPHSCKWCHKQYASKAKLLQHQRKKHADIIDQESPNAEKMNEDDLIGDIVQQDGYYHFVSMEDVQFDQTDLEGESRLCKLLSSESNLVPPR